MSVFGSLTTRDYSVIGVTTAIISVVWRLFFTGPPRKRAMSFNSVSMIQGAFPSECNVTPPIINALLLFKSCPSIEGVKDVAKNLMQYDRFRQVVRQADHTKTWYFKEAFFDVERLFSTGADIFSP